MAAGISVHAVDVAAGIPAQGLRVRLLRIDAQGGACIAEGELDAHGALGHPVTRGDGVRAGTHEVHLHVGDWWRAREGIDERFFQEVVVFRFEVLDVEEHYHLPIKFTRWGLALFRGA